MARRRGRRPHYAGKSTKRSNMVRMLNLRKEGEFQYDLRELLTRANMDERQRSSFMATLISKGERTSIAEAKRYVRLKCDEGLISEEISREIHRLLDRFSRYR